MGCEDDKKSNLLDPNAMISLRPDASMTRADANPEHLSALEIVKQARSIFYWNRDITTNNPIIRGFSDTQKDFVNVRLLMFGTDIIDQDGLYTSEFIESEDIVL